MMKDIKKEAKQSSLINDKIRNSGFVHYKLSDLEGFKNSATHNIMKKVKPKLQNLKRRFNSFIEKPRLLLSFIDWEQTKKDIIPWSLEVILEGLIANWWTHKIFGLDFEIGMIIAHGFLIKQGLDLHRRIKKDGQHSKLLNKNK